MRQEKSREEIGKQKIKRTKIVEKRTEE